MLERLCRREGATEVSGGPEAAERAVAAARAAAQAIHGLGPGGNVPAAPPQQQPQAERQQPDEAAGPATDGGGGSAAGGRDRRGGGRGRGGGGRGRGGREGGSGDTQRDRLRKDQNKAAVANHHRKERAARKAGVL